MSSTTVRPRVHAAAGMLCCAALRAPWATPAAACDRLLWRGGTGQRMRLAGLVEWTWQLARRIPVFFFCASFFSFSRPFLLAPAAHTAAGVLEAHCTQWQLFCGSLPFLDACPLYIPLMKHATCAMLRPCILGVLLGGRALACAVRCQHTCAAIAAHALCQRQPRCRGGRRWCSCALVRTGWRRRWADGTA